LVQARLVKEIASPGWRYESRKRHGVEGYNTKGHEEKLYEWNIKTDEVERDLQSVV
jgi:hypothetical protein